MVIRLCSSPGFPKHPVAVLRQVHSALLQLKDRLDGAGAAPRPRTAQLQHAEEQGSSGLASPCSAKGSNMHPPQLQQHSEAWDFLKCCKVKFCTKSQLTTAALCPGCARH